ncbi:MAG: hypothetical protein RIB58_09635 [Phycisphaerales bacterium]
MLMAVVAVLGVLVAGWTLIGELRREEIKVLASLHRARIRERCVLAGVVVLGSPVLMAWVFWEWPPTRAGETLAGAIESIVLVAVTAYALWPIREALRLDRGLVWNLEHVQAATGRIQELVRQGKASTAAAVVARFAPMVDRPKREDGELDAYEAVLDWCLRHEAFVEAMVNEQTEAVAELLKAETGLRWWQADRLVTAAFTRPPYGLITEVADCTSPASYEPEHFIPPECVLLHALADDPRVAERVGAWKSVGDAVVDELRARRAGLSDHGVDVLSPDMNHEGFMKSPIDAGIEFLHILAARAVYEKLGDTIDVYYYKEFTRHILPLLPEPKPIGNISEQTRYHWYLWQMLDNLQNLVFLRAPRLPDQNGGDGQHADDQPVSSMRRRCMKTYAWCVGEVVRSDHAPHQLKVDRVAQAVDFYGTLVTGMPMGYVELGQHAEVLLTELRIAFRSDFDQLVGLANDPLSDVDLNAFSLFNKAMHKAKASPKPPPND